MERRLAAILAADVVGYSRLMERDEAGTLASLKAHREELIDPAISNHHGRIVKLMGDGTLVEFASVVDAVACAVAIQEGMAERNEELPEDCWVKFRIGVHLGDVMVEGEDLYGDGVNVAARLEGLAEPGSICLSQQAYDQVETKLDLNVQDLGEQQVKNIARPVRAYRVLREGEAPTPHKPPKRYGLSDGQLIGSVAVVVVIVATLIAGWWQPWAPDVEPASVENMAFALPDKPSVAVLPFANLSDDQAQEYFANGLTDDLITDLSKVSGLFVIARNSVFTFKGRGVRLKEIAEELGVRYVVEGSVRRAGNRVRVNAQLIEGSTGHHVWAERYDREITDLFAVQDDLIGQIVSALAVQLTRTEETQIARPPTRNLEAYDLYLRAREHYFSGEADRLVKSLELYEQAQASDPTFAKAHAGYARAAADLWRLAAARGRLSSPLVHKAAEDAAKRALVLDPTTADAHSVLALLKMGDGDHDDAVRLARRAVELDPNNADAYTGLAVVLGYAGQPEAALEAIRTAVRLNPRPSQYYWTYYGWALFLNHKYDDAIGVLESVADTPGQGLADAPREILAMAYAETGRLDEARAQVEAVLEQDPYVSVALYRAFYDHHAREEDLHHRLDALRKAGVPEWPFGYEGDPKHRLETAELQNLISGKKWSGVDAGRKGPFVEEFGENGDVIYAAATTLMTGTAFIKDGELCERFELFILGRDGCGPVYRNPAGTSADRNEFVYVNSATARYFSVDE